jgi:hypothetical protein
MISQVSSLKINHYLCRIVNESEATILKFFRSRKLKIYYDFSSSFNNALLMKGILFRSMNNTTHIKINYRHFIRMNRSTLTFIRYLLSVISCLLHTLTLLLLSEKKTGHSHRRPTLVPFSLII